jgi:hypothetical protein
MRRYTFLNALPGPHAGSGASYSSVLVAADGGAAAGERIRVHDDVQLSTTEAQSLLARVDGIFHDATASSGNGSTLRVQWYFRSEELPFLRDTHFKVRRAPTTTHPGLACRASVCA